MAPFLTSRGKALLAVAMSWLMVAAILLVAGRSGAAWPLLFSGSGLLVFLLLVFYSAVSMAKVVDGVHLLLCVEAPTTTVSLHTSERTSPMLTLFNRSGLRLRRIILEPELSTALRLDVERLPELELPPGGRVQLEVPLSARRSGTWFVHGFHFSVHDFFDLFVVKNYKASACRMTFLPRGLLDRRISHLRPALAMLHERIGVHEVRNRGFGTDLREIRDHQHGDPFRNIAWKATARTGRLMVREFESEISLSAYLVVDISATMRGAIDNGGKLEHAIRLACNFGRAVLRGNDRCGLITFDEKIYGHLPPKEGPAQMRRISQHLVASSNVVDETLTEYDEEEVIEALAKYLMLQRRLDFRRRQQRRRSRSALPGVEDVYDVELLNRWLKVELQRTGASEAVPVGVLNQDALSLARRYCQVHGVEIPYRSELRYGTKEQGLADTLEEIMRSSRNPQIILILSDMAGIIDMDRLTKMLRLARLRRHKVAVVAPHTPSYVVKETREGAPQWKILHELFSAAEGRERRAVVRALRGAATPIVEVGPDVGIAHVLRKLHIFN